MIGGPLRTGRGRSIDEVIRTTAPMHEGFAGGAFVDMTSAVIGIATAASIRGLGVIIPAAIAWKTAASLLQHGRIRRGYLGIAGQPVRLSDDQHALLIVDVKSDSPAAAAGLRVGDSITKFDGHSIEDPEDLLELLNEERVGRTVDVGIVRGGGAKDVKVSIGER